MERQFTQLMQQNYLIDVDSLCLGGMILDNQPVADIPLDIALKTLNRHGLIAGATGTGKTKTIQMLCERLSLKGVPCLVMDMKGDLSGLSMPGEPNEKILARQESLGLDFKPQAYPVQFLSLGDAPGVKVRTTLTEFGSLLLAKMLNLNETQTSILSILFQYAADNDLLLIDLEDLKALLAYAQGEGKSKIETSYGGISPASIKAILRSVIELEGQGGDTLFAEPSFDIHDLLRLDAHNYGFLSILRLMDIQEKPKVFSSFMLGLLNDLYRQLPEIGDPEQPKLVMFIDEAHLIFNNASTALLNKIETIVKLIRSKGVGLIFCSQSPNDIPEAILGQLGLKIQHALRAFTVKDRKAIKLIAENFPASEYYDTQTLLTSLGIGECLLTALNVKGQPTPLVQARIRAPQSRMGPVSEAELEAIVSQSPLTAKYEHILDKPSAAERLKQRQQHEPENEVVTAERKDTGSSLGELSKNTLFRQIIRTIVREVTRSLMVLLGIKKTSNRRKR